VLDEETGTIEVIVPDDQQSLAIGRRGQNVRLASQLTGWHIEILTEAAESERRQEEFKTRSALFIEALDVDEVIAHLLVTEGFRNIEDVAFVPLEELAAIEGFQEIAEELRERAQAYLEKRDAELTEKRRQLGVEDSVAEIEDLNPQRLVKLGEAGVKTMEDLADLSTEELRFYMLDAPPKISPEEFGHLKEERRAKLLAKSVPEDGKVALTAEMLNYMKPHRLNNALGASPLKHEDAEKILLAARKKVYGDEFEWKKPEAEAPKEGAAA
jgi:transcription termination factor NusA